MPNIIKLENKRHFAAAVNSSSVLGASPQLHSRPGIDKSTVEKEYIRDCLLNEAEAKACITNNSYDHIPETIDGLMASRISTAIHSVASLVSNNFLSAMQNPEIKTQVCARSNAYIKGQKELQNSGLSPFTEATIDSARINASGTFLYNQLTQVDPRQFITRIRGTAFHLLPINPLGAGASDWERTGYDTSGNFVDEAQSTSQELGTIEVTVKSDLISVNTPKLSLRLTTDELISTFVGQELSNNNTNRYVGQFHLIQMKFIGLMQAYFQTLDSICFGGVYNARNPGTLENRPFSSIIEQEGVFHKIPTLPTGKTSFSSFTATEQFEFMGKAATLLSNEGLGSQVVDAMFINLSTFNEMLTKMGEQQDSTAMMKIVSQGVVRALFPVTSWDLMYPDKATVMACNLNPFTLDFNVPLPLYMTGYNLKNDVTEMQYAFTCGGLIVHNKFGVNAFQIDK